MTPCFISPSIGSNLLQHKSSCLKTCEKKKTTNPRLIKPHPPSAQVVSNFDVGAIAGLLTIVGTGFTLDRRFKSAQADIKANIKSGQDRIEERMESIENALSSITPKALYKSEVNWLFKGGTEASFTPLMVGTKHSVVYKAIIDSAPESVDRSKTFIIETGTRNLIEQNGEQLITSSDMKSGFFVEIK